jgi:hypothetical protein
MAEEYNTFIAVVFHGGTWWVRLSGQIHLEKKDYQWAGRILKELCHRVKNGEYLKSENSV